MRAPSAPEVWLRGPVTDCPAELMPVAHSLMQIREEIAAIVPSLSLEQLGRRPGGAASVRFHLLHLGGSLDRLLTYARGESLSAAQRKALEEEEDARSEPIAPGVLLELVERAIDRALEQVRSTPVATLLEPRLVGRSGLPSTVLGLLFHAAEHAQRHAGQIATTAKIVLNERSPDNAPTATRP
jgi:uncharacterized damage-inducible protein DinB